MPRNLETILADEGAALVEGRFDRLSSLAEEREALLARTDEDALGDAVEIRRLATRNMALAQAASRGLADARDRASKIVKGASLETYSPEGKRHSFRDARPNLQRRA